MKILVTTTSFQDTPGKHHDLLEKTGFEVDYLRGPVKENVLLPIIDNYDGVICGDDEFSRKVIEKGESGKLKVISKYGIGLDKIDLIAAKDFDIPVYNTPGVNQITVAEHTLALILTYLKNIHLEYNITKDGKWDRLIGHELYGQKVGVIGLGRIGKELIKRLSVFGVEIYGYDLIYDEEFIKEYSVKIVNSVVELALKVDILSIHMPLTSQTKYSINEFLVSKIESPLIIINTSRARIVETKALIHGLKTGKIRAYLTDVLEQEPMTENCVLKDFENVIITPHIGSRTYESVVRQGCMAVKNLIGFYEKN